MKEISFITFILYTLLCLFTIQTRAISYFLSQRCPNTTVFALNSTYQSNLKTIFSALSSNATNNPTGFYSSSAGVDTPDVAYGAFLCRGDLSSDVCGECVSNATEQALDRCGLAKVATIWYDLCMIRYANQLFLGEANVWDAAVLYIPASTVPGPKNFEDVLGKTLNDVATRAAADLSGKKFAVHEANLTALQTLYALAQCTPDLTSYDCNLCLRRCISNIGTCCDQSPGATHLLPSCNVRYQLFPFYNATVAVPSPLSPPPPRPDRTPVRPPSPPVKRKRGISLKVLVAIAVPIAVAGSLFILGFFLLTRKKPVIKNYDSVGAESDGGIDFTTEHSLQYDLATIQAATNYFSQENKIGQGGFGPVYKGILSNGQEIAVKRLSPNAGQGAAEFKTEVVVVAKLQHRNLVRLCGFCLEAKEKILIYEFVPNKSLDYLLFDTQESRKLDWSRRYNIIGGIAKGMLYLHEDSRLRIIHRDLKASNVLLDKGMNAKVSDFGTAKIFGVDETRGSTSRVVGTFGYMAPEYANHGHFSVKSDVFSFGVLVLEIVTGKNNGSFCQSDGGDNLLSYAWKLLTEGSPLDLVDPVLEGCYSRNEVTRCIHIGLLCVQEDAVARPSMATVVMMLNHNSVTLSVPQKPAFFPRNRTSLRIPNLTTDSVHSTHQ